MKRLLQRLRQPLPDRFYTNKMFRLVASGLNSISIEAWVFIWMLLLVVATWVISWRALMSCARYIGEMF